jgi:TonB-dependent receptor
VRGLSDRYTGTTLNGVRVPSSDPRKRAVQLDVFPTGTVESVTVHKTFTPDLQGDFTGGGVDIKTKSAPEETLLSLSLSAEHNSEATGDEILSYPGGGVDALGRAGAERELPEETAAPLPNNLDDITFSGDPSPEDMEAAAAYDRLTRSFAPAMGVNRTDAGLNRGMSFVAGDGFALGDDRLSLMGALTYSNKYDAYEGGKNNVAAVSTAGDAPALVYDRTDSVGSEELLSGALASAAWRRGEAHALTLRWIRNESITDEARFQVDEQACPSAANQNQSLHYTERSVTSWQLHGHHDAGLPALDWMLGTNATRQEEPDLRFFRNRTTFGGPVITASLPINATAAQNTRRVFREIEEDNLVGGFDVSLPVGSWTDEAIKLKTGIFFETSDREYTPQSFTYEFATQSGSSSNPDVNANQAKENYRKIFPPVDTNGDGVPDAPGKAPGCAGNGAQYLWTDVFTDADRVGFAPNTDSPAVADNQLLYVLGPLDDVEYRGDQEIGAAYAMAELPVRPHLDLILGVRHETTELFVDPHNAEFGIVEVVGVGANGNRYIVDVPEDEAEADIDEGSLLPSVGVVYEALPQMKLRATWSQTIARPTFRELAPVITEEFIEGDEFLGNPEVKLSDITNYDLRWEWFRRPGEVLAASVFYKAIEDPIELLSFFASNRSFIQPVNYEQGDVRGFEVEGRTSLDVLSPSLRELSLGMNYTLIDSAVDVPLEEQERLASYGLDEPSRRLQGQPAYLFNFNASYDSERLGLSASAFYNRVGETLLTGAAIGENGTPNVFEETFTAVNASVSKRIAKHFHLSFGGKNLLRSEKKTVYRTPQGQEAVKTGHVTAVRYTLAAKWDW